MSFSFFKLKTVASLSRLYPEILDIDRTCAHGPSGLPGQQTTGCIRQALLSSPMGPAALGLGHPFVLVREEAKCFHSGYSGGPMLTSGRQVCIYFYFYF